MNETLIEAGTHILSELKEEGVYTRDPDTWEEMLYTMFDWMIERKAKSFCAESLLWFAAAAHSRMFENGGQLSIEEGILILISKLGYDGDIIRVRRLGPHRYLESTSKCVTNYGAFIRVQLDEAGNHSLDW